MTLAPNIDFAVLRRVFIHVEIDILMTSEVARRQAKKS